MPTKRLWLAQQVESRVAGEEGSGDLGEEDPLYEDAVRSVLNAGQASTSVLQRRLRIGYGRHSFLLTGDIERPVERKMLAEGSLKKTDVLKVAHHGSRTSSTAAWVEAVQPAFGLISSGFENAFHHPSPEVLKRLEEHHVSVMRTDLQGLLTIRSDGRRFQVETMRWSEPGGLYSAF